MVIDGYDDFEPADDMVAEDSDKEHIIIEVAPADIEKDNMVVEDSDEEDHIIEYPENSDYDSSCSELSIEQRYREISEEELMSLHELRKMCVIYIFYLSEDDGKFRTSCFFRWADLFSDMRTRAVRRHQISIFGLILGEVCDRCGNPLHQIFPCNLCPICTQ
ncbi:zinc finger zz-type and ef-hand domain-containing protein [Lasius niger]|uniref:Zinc finger zz-type and ef-hand domain-containing protein n=1 Tax=Lasius niger TaxID=67767 RepID=A0A0J7KC42_LASNI|nr:zinc finger zz-type and ef-hand domain-containing protein [Lasius niger]